MRDGEVLSLHLFGQPVDLPSGVAEDDCLSDGQRFVNVAQRFKFPFFLVDHDVELLDTFQAEFIFLHENAHRVTHELLGHFQHIRWHGGGQQNYLHFRAQVAEHIVDLILETAGQHFVGFVQNEKFDVIGAQYSTGNHVKHTTRSAGYDVHAGLQRADVASYRGTTDRSVTVRIHVIAQRANHFTDL